MLFAGAELSVPPNAGLLLQNAGRFHKFNSMRTDQAPKIDSNDPLPGATLARRDALKKAVALLAGAASATVLRDTQAGEHKPRNTEPRTQGASVVAKDDAPVVAISSGKVVGYTRNGVCTFKGIPYAESTEGENRFMPPVRAKPWSGVRSSRQYGHVAPQASRSGWDHDEEAFMFAWDDGIQGEDCLRVNVWTPAVNDGKKRPVMIWLHGGGFAAGSGQELKSYDGENLARRGDVVVVSLNHRLNVLGYLNLASYGERYASSANVGMLDIIAALEWVREDIAGFGGDANSVTIFGQSGGGGKVGALMGMPAAKGLFHRAIVESGSMMRLGTVNKSQQFADLIVAELGLNQSSIQQIHSMPFERLVLASIKVMHDRNPAPGGIPNFRRLADVLGFLPVVDGKILPAHPFDPQASPLSADVPMIIGSTLNEFVTAVNHPEYESMTNDELQQRVKALYSEKAPQIIEVFRNRSPKASPFDLWSRIGAAPVRQAAIAQAAAKTAQGAAPAYLYWFTWQTPVLNGRPRAFHCAELPFVFDNTDRCETMTGGGADARSLAARMSEAWIRFARTGNPNHPGMPRWEPFSADLQQTMIFDNHTLLVNGPDRAEQGSIADG
jgi:para-nitrobenzyl esterase